MHLFRCFFLFNKENKSKTNFYFIIILLLFGLIRFEFSLETLGIISTNTNPLRFRASLGLILIPVLYLFLHKLIKQQAQSIKDLYYFIPTILSLIIIEISPIINLDTHKYISLINFAAYYLSILYQFRILFYIKKCDFQTTKYLQSIKAWFLIVLFFFTTIIILGITILFVVENRIQIMQNFYKYSSFIWLFIFYYLFKNPIIIFGEKYLINNILISKKEDFLIWSLTANRKTEEKDLPLYKNCKDNIANLIFEIRKIEDNELIISKETLKLDFLTKFLKTPRSHLEFVFKYHCQYSVNDYVNLIKIKYALRLIDSGYLNSMTINALAEKTLFSSRTTFFLNFKKFMGIPITTYVNQTGVTLEKYQIYLNRV